MSKKGDLQHKFLMAVGFVQCVWEALSKRGNANNQVGFLDKLMGRPDFE